MVRLLAGLNWHEMTEEEFSGLGLIQHDAWRILSCGPQFSLFLFFVSLSRVGLWVYNIFGVGLNTRTADSDQFGLVCFLSICFSNPVCRVWMSFFRGYVFDFESSKTRPCRHLQKFIDKQITGKVHFLFFHNFEESTFFFLFFFLFSSFTH